MEDAMDVARGYEEGQRIAGRVGGGGEDTSSKEEGPEEGGEGMNDSDDDQHDSASGASGDGMDSQSDWWLHCHDGLVH
jgi:hypothetical protein